MRRPNGARVSLYCQRCGQETQALTPFVLRGVGLLRLCDTCLRDCGRCTHDRVADGNCGECASHAARGVRGRNSRE